MILQQIIDLVSPTEGDLYRLKPIGRKSILQSHTWYLCNTHGPQLVIKFATSDLSLKLVQRERTFYRRIDSIRTNLLVLRVIAKWIDVNLSSCTTFLVLKYEVGKLPTRWMTKRMESDSPSVLMWIERVLCWLYEFQNDPTVRHCMSVPEGQVLCHGDFSHYNIMETDNGFKIFDWENWTYGQPFLDALHLLVMPTLGSGDEQMQVEGFKHYWIDSDAYRSRALVALTPFLNGIELDWAMNVYLSHQVAQLALHAPANAQVFVNCRRLWRQTA